LLTTKENAGSSQSGGLEFSFSGKILPKLSINTSGNLAYQEQNSFSGISLMSKRSATSLSMRARVNYQVTEFDQLQISLNAHGKTLSGQGYRQPSATANFSYRRTITPTLNLVMNVTDIFNSNKIETVIDTVTLKEVNVRRFDGRILFIGLSYRLGGFTPPARGGTNGNRAGRPEGQGAPGGFLPQRD
jgi:ABC-type oligopeptide transport system ATPase subunit